jgi:hypothetical protein
MYFTRLVFYEIQVNCTTGKAVIHSEASNRKLLEIKKKKDRGI